VAGEHRKDITYRDATVQVDGYDAISFRDSRICRFPLEPGASPDALESVSRGQAVIVTSSLARHFGTRVGDTMTLNSPNGPQALTVAGITKCEPTAAVIMNRTRLKEGWNDTSVTWVRIALDDPAQRPQVQAAIVKALGTDYRVNVRPGPALLDYVANEVRKAFNALYLLQGITFVLLLIAIGDTLATGVIERTRQFGMMRAIGLHRSHLFTMVMLEGTAVGTLGLVLAALLGLGLGVLWVRVQFPAMLGWDVDLHWPAVFAAAAVLGSLLLCAIGSILPSLHAARLSLPKTLRNE
jgi:putative ABC transport system permease protein